MMDSQQAKIKKLALFDELCNTEAIVRTIYLISYQSIILVFL